MEQALVEQAGLTFAPISAAGVRGKGPTRSLIGTVRLGQGYFESRRLIRRFRPDVLFVTGGYVCVPVSLAAWWARVPIIIYLPDIEPGLAIKNLARFAGRVAVTVPEAQPFFKPGLTVVTGYPVRAALTEAITPESKQLARQQLGLISDDLPLLFVFGGSRGAHSLNQVVVDNLSKWLPRCHILHMTGPLDESWVQAKRAELPSDLQARYQVAAYLHNQMVPALKAADLGLSRAGASVLGEFPAVGLPVILVPYPYAGAHQALNAAYLVEHGAALTINDNELGLRLNEIVLDILTNREKLQTMSQASRRLARPEAALRLAEEILGVSRG